MFSPFVLKPGDSKELIIMPKFKDGIAIEAMGNRYIEFWIHWRRGNATWTNARARVHKYEDHQTARWGGIAYEGFELCPR
jgi:hypothetical protein